MPNNVRLNLPNKQKTNVAEGSVIVSALAAKRRTSMMKNRRDAGHGLASKSW